MQHVLVEGDLGLLLLLLIVTVPEEGMKVLRTDDGTAKEPGANHSARATAPKDCEERVIRGEMLTKHRKQTKDLGITIPLSERCILQMLVSKCF